MKLRCFSMSKSCLRDLEIEGLWKMSGHLWQTSPFMPLLDITPLKNQLENDGLSTPIRPPPSADGRLLRDLKEQVTVLQKDVSQQAQRCSGRRMVIQIPKRHVGLEYFLPRFFSFFQLAMV